MTRSTLILPLLAVAALAGCASYPMPVQRLADAEAAARSAQETGASASPQAQLHLTLAREEIARAQQLFRKDENKRAELMLLRAKSDAELALAEAREQQARIDAEKANRQLTEATTQVSATTTTSATIQVQDPTQHSTSTTTTTQESKP